MFKISLSIINGTFSIVSMLFSLLMGTILIFLSSIKVVASFAGKILAARRWQ